MSDIQILSPEVIDQIAAGEVVERPAHMVKELVENAIDSGAQNIEIEFDQGGRWLRVSDDGCGIKQDQLKLAVSRHATSKIKKSADIWALNSFGFRGEALASIASVSEMSITSRVDGQSSASRLNIEFGKIKDTESVGGEVGTTVFIKELFANMPARLKFLKSETAESTQIKNALKAMALHNHEINFRVRHKSKLLFFWPAAKNTVERVQAIFEQEKMYEGHGECNGITADVVLASPNNTVRTSKQIWLFCQGRYIQDRGLQAAVMDGYRSLLMHGEFPIAYVSVSLSPEDVDVNIHPTKSQVKFKSQSDAFRAVSRAVRSVLEKAPWLESFSSPEVDGLEIKGQDIALQPPAPEPVNLNFSANEFDKVQYAKKSFAEPQKVTLADLQAAMKVPSSGQGLETVSESPLPPVGDYSTENQSSHWSQLQILGQAALTYIITQSDKEIVFIDQHAAHERVMYEKLMKSWKEGRIEVQDFLMPITVDLDEDQVELILNEKENLSKLGLNVEAMGPAQLAVSSAPTFVNDKSIVKVMELLGRELVDLGGSFAFEKVVSDIIATMACHSAIRAGQSLSHQEMQSLMVQMDEFAMSSFALMVDLSLLNIL